MQGGGRGMKTLEEIYANKWDLESNSIRCAFGLQEDCFFEPQYRNRQTHFILRQSPWAKYPSLPYHYRDDGLRFEAKYFVIDRLFTLWADGIGTQIRIYPDTASLTERSTLDLAPKMAEGLFKTGLLFPFVEEALNYYPTAHERLEWQLEYEARLNVQGITK